MKPKPFVALNHFTVPTDISGNSFQWKKPQRPCVRIKIDLEGKRGWKTETDRKRV
jgi:hypothetical protein